jgi:hypothetical protein
MQRNKAYYTVSMLKDGIIWLANQTRKPRGGRGWRAPRSDEDGIWRALVDKVDDDKDWHEWVEIVRSVNIATGLNVRRAIRQQVECNLLAANQRLDALEVQMKRIEQKIDSLLAQRQ